MRTPQTSMAALQRQSLIEDLSASIMGLFGRRPELSGFSVQDDATLTHDRKVDPLCGELCVADLALEGWAACNDTRALRGEIVGALLELFDEHPEAIQLVRGRSFARVLH